MSLATKLPDERKREILGILLLGMTLFLLLVLVTNRQSMGDSGGLPLDEMDKVSNLFGWPGASLAWSLTFLGGDAAHVLYALTFIWGMMLLTHRPVDRLLTRLTGMVLLALAVASTLQVNLPTGSSNHLAGGVVGAFVADRLLLANFGYVGSNVIGVTFGLIGILLSTDFLLVHVVLLLKRSFVHLMRGNLAIFEGVRTLWGSIALRARERRRQAQAEHPFPEIAEVEEPALAAPKRVARAAQKAAAEAEAQPSLERIRVQSHEQGVTPQVEEAAFEEVESLEPEFEAEEDPALMESADMPWAMEAEELEASAQAEAEPPVLVKTPPKAPAQTDLEFPTPVLASKPLPAAPRPRRKNAFDEELPPDYQYPRRYTKPSLDILDEARVRIIPNLDAQLRSTSLLLEETLQTFGIEARVTDVTRGPTITRFELEPAPGIKVSRFLALADDVALALKAHRIRVEAPIPGKGRVGIEAPNHERDQVLVRELLENPLFRKSKGKLNLALGKDITGGVQIADLAGMPHLLVAGATGAGKTVCVKALLASMLFSKTPDELQLMLIDPKMVELSIFNDIPHLITPVVTDPKKAAVALTWLINEMEERYRLFADLRVRNIEVYNQSVQNGEIEMTHEGEESHEALCAIRQLPYIVCVIDELADLMMLARAEVEDSIGRLAQLARAVGIHLIIATQRPSVDVLTGVIKANFPARLSFQVSSRVDSRCILDEIGAERLIGMGDMLYLPAGQSKPTRIQGAFVSDDEMSSLIAYLKTQAPPQYRDEIENFGKSKDKLSEIMEEDDPLFEEAVQIVLESGQASISMVQRRLRVGYTRAARLIDMMELKGIVGPHTGSKAREILVGAGSQGYD